VPTYFFHIFYPFISKAAPPGAAPGAAAPAQAGGHARYSFPLGPAPAKAVADPKAAAAATVPNWKTQPNKMVKFLPGGLKLNPRQEK